MKLMLGNFTRENVTHVVPLLADGCDGCDGLDASKCVEKSELVAVVKAGREAKA